jgi:type I restriction enzyme S subunit
MNKMKKGYKITEIGVVPEDWKVKKIGDIAPLQRGFDLPNRYLQKGDFPVVYSNGILNYHKKFLAKAPGIVTGRSGTIGKVSYVEDDYWPHNTTLWVTDFKNNYPKFVYYLFLHIRLERFASGSGVPTLNRNDVHNYRIAIPKELPEQKAIAKVLSDTDNLIQVLEKRIAKKRLIKQGAMQKLLTPDDWEVKKLGEFLKVRHGKSQKDVEDKNGQYPILGTGGLMGYTNQFLYDRESVLIGRKGTIDKPRYMDIPFWTVDTLFYTEIFKGVSPKCLFYKFLQIDWYSYNEASGVPSLNAKTIENIEISLPPLEQQTHIATILSDMDSEIEALEKKRAKYKQLKQGLMQNLLTGKIRLI